MLGVVVHENDDPADQLLREFGEQIGVGDTYQKTPIGVFLGEPGKTVPDPYFGGEGPDRTGCMQCGRCMVGCPHGAKNTLVKNYLWLAERRGVEVTPDRTGDRDPPARRRRRQRRLRGHQRALRAAARPRPPHRSPPAASIVAAGPLGTNKLLQRCRLGGSLPRISNRLGELVRTNSEMILAVTVPEDYPDDLTKRVAITSSIYPDPHTHIETVTYGKDGDSMNALYTLLVGDGTQADAAAEAAGADRPPPAQVRAGDVAEGLVAAHDHRPGDADARQRDRPAAEAEALRRRAAADRAGPRATEPDLHPGRQRGGRMAGRAHRRDRPERGQRGAASTCPTTAHILGGAVIGHGPEDGVVDARQRVFGYENLLVCDGAAVPANVGVNPSLTITALAEHAMAQIPPRRGGAAPPRRRGRLRAALRREASRSAT